jgi:hypothetical protein
MRLVLFPHCAVVAASLRVGWLFDSGGYILSSLRGALAAEFFAGECVFAVIEIPLSPLPEVC